MQTSFTINIYLLTVVAILSSILAIVKFNYFGMGVVGLNVLHLQKQAWERGISTFPDSVFVSPGVPPYFLAPSPSRWAQSPGTKIHLGGQESARRVAPEACLPYVY